MHTSPQLDLHLLQLSLHAFANRLPKHQKPSPFRLPANMLEAEKIEGLRLTQTSALSVRRRVASELEQARLFRVQFQLNFAIRSASSFQNCSASSLRSNPTTMSSA